jgi:hypothetical protein
MLKVKNKVVKDQQDSLLNAQREHKDNKTTFEEVGEKQAEQWELLFLNHRDVDQEFEDEKGEAEVRCTEEGREVRFNYCINGGGVSKFKEVQHFLMFCIFVD